VTTVVDDVDDVALPEEAAMIPPDEFFLRIDAPAAAPNLLLEDTIHSCCRL